MSRLDEKQDAFKQRLEALHAEQAGVGAGLPPAPELGKLGDVSERLAAYDAWLEQRAALWRGQDPRPAGEAAPAERAAAAPRATGSGKVEVWREEDDRRALAEFDLARFTRPGGFGRPSILVERSEDFLKKLAEGMRLSPAERAAFLADPPAAARGLGAVYLPEQGCLVDVEHFTHREGISPGRQLRQNQTARVDVLRGMVQERWGSGFVLEYTAFGRGLLAAELYPAMLGRRAGLTLARWQPGLEKLAALDLGTQIAWTGWREWVWDFLGTRMLRPLGEGKEVPRPNLRRTGEILNRVVRLFPVFIDIGDVAVKLSSVWDIFRYLFLQETKLAGKAVNQLLLAAEAYCGAHDADNERIEGVRVRSLLGWYYLSGLEAVVSSYCLPYAILIAFHVPADLLRASAAEVGQKMKAEPLYNPDARLALLNGLNPSARYTPRAIRLAARELGLLAPEQYFPQG